MVPRLAFGILSPWFFRYPDGNFAEVCIFRIKWLDADGALTDAAVISVTEALEETQGVMDLKVEVHEGTGIVEISPDTMILSPETSYIHTMLVITKSQLTDTRGRRRSKPQMEVILFQLLICATFVLTIWSTSTIATATSSESALPTAKPNCETHCGNISIPYPFGIGPNKDCYFDEWFEIECIKNSSSLHKPFLRRTQPMLEVLNISVEGTLLVKNPVTFFYGGNRTRQLAPNLTGGPFKYSEVYNRVTAMSCGFFALVRSEYDQSVLGGCFSSCNANSATIYNNGYDCLDGINCCQATLTPYLTLLTTKIHYSDQTDEERVTYYNYAFLAEQTWFQNNNFSNTTMELKKAWFGQNLSKFKAIEADTGMVPVVLDWSIRLYDTTSYFSRFKGFIGSQSSHSNYNDSRPYCEATSSSYNNVPRLDCSCACPLGFEGNPYLLQPCQDVDECTGSNQCVDRGETCENFIGGYKCYSNRTGVTCEYHADHYGAGITSSCYITSMPSATINNVRTILLGLGVGVGILLLLIGTWLVYKVVKTRKKIQRKKMLFKRNGGLLLEQQLLSDEVNVEKIKLFESKELEKATDKFNTDRILGQGAQGTVFKGMLADGRIVAVKKSKLLDQGNLSEFINEVVILSQINHRNVVQLLGCCLETEIPLLVYEFIPNGMLSQYIHEKNEEFPLTWNLRLQIATEISGALAYLHSAASHPIYHRDIKSSNILLDEKYRAKVADFGTSRSIAIDQTHLTTSLVHGTFGYLDPEYFQSNQYTEKSDVYSFGVVLVELLTGKKPISFLRSEEEGRSLATYFIISMQKDRLFEIVDARVLKEGSKANILVVANLARRCLNLNGRQRPTMREVTAELEWIQMLAKTSIDEQNYEEVDFVRTDLVQPWDDLTGTGSALEASGSRSSFHEIPLLSFKSSRGGESDHIKVEGYSQVGRKNL